MPGLLRQSPLQRQAILRGSSSASMRLLPLLVLQLLPGVLEASRYTTVGLLQTPVHDSLPEASMAGMQLIQLAASGPAASARRQQREVPAALVAISSSNSGSHRTSQDTTSRSQGGHNSTSEVQEGAASKDLPATWFGSFSKDESTYDPDDADEHPENPLLHDAIRVSEAGNTVNMAANEDPIYYSQEGVPSEWFEESQSGAMNHAWRTRFPPLEAFRNEGIKTVPWLPDHSGRQQKTFLPSAATSIARAFDITKKKDAEWFENSVQHRDDFGRDRPPTERSDRFYWDWEEKSWNVSFGCPDPGCIANATLPTFDSKALQHRRCRLTLKVHATDFDDEYSREHVEWFIVNGAYINTRCDPMAHGCNKSVEDKDRGMHPCVSDYPLDNILDREETGTELQIAGKISDTVDECPFENNLLSGNAKVTCFVKPWPVPTEPPGPNFPSDGNDTCPNSTDLQCAERGCAAQTVATLCGRKPSESERCTLNVRIWQTDFDGDHGSNEIVEWVKVNNKTIKENIKLSPGRNPCKEAFFDPQKAKEAREASLAATDATTIAPSESGISLDDQSRALLATIPDDTDTVADGCRRRILNPSQAASFLREQEEQPRNQDEINHLRADDDEEDMYNLVTKQDITEEAKITSSFVVEAKISDKVDECAKDGYLLNAKVFIECK